MKKNRTMRAAVLLLALTLITSCFVGGTFAKYTASASASSTARVAYWGFNSSAETELGLFDFEDTGIMDGEENLIAPGSGKEVTFKILAANDVNKAPEVAYKLDIGINGKSPAYSATSGFGGVDGLIDWYITYGEETNKYDTWKDFRTAFGALDGEGYGAGGYKLSYTVYEPGELPDILKGEEVKIGWIWEFEDEHDAEDTVAGNSALNTYYGDMEVKVTVLVEQWDGTKAPDFN